MMAILCNSLKVSKLAFLKFKMGSFYQVHGLSVDWATKICTMNIDFETAQDRNSHWILSWPSSCIAKSTCLIKYASVNEVTLVVASGVSNFKPHIINPSPLNVTSLKFKTPLAWRRRWQPTPVFLPGEFHEQRSLASYSPWGCKELDTTEQLTYTHYCNQKPKTDTQPSP